MHRIIDGRRPPKVRIERFLISHGRAGDFGLLGALVARNRSSPARELFALSERCGAQAKRFNMIRPYRPLLMLVVCRALVGVAAAEDTTIWLETLLDRAPDDLSEPQDTKVSGNAAHTFANDFIVGGSFEIEKTTSGVWSYNLEGTFGYDFKLTSYASVGGSAGVGERWQPATSGGDFPYYVVRVRADLDLSDRWSWNLITYR
jgi:hypothetical protein